MAEPGRIETLLRRGLLLVSVALPCVLGLATTYVLLPLLLVSFVYLAVRRRLRLDFAGRGFLLAFVVLALVAGFDAVIGGHPDDAKYSFDFGMLLLYAPIASLYDRAAGPRNTTVAADLALAGTALALAFGMFQALLYQPDRVGYLTADPIRYADTALLLGFLALMGLPFRTSPWRWLHLLGPVFALIAILLSGSRAALFAFPVLLLVAIIMLLRRRALALGIAAFGLFAALLVAIDRLRLSRSTSLFDAALNLFRGGGLGDESARQRLVLYRAGWATFLQSPLFGVGWHRRMEVAGTYMPDADKGLATLPHLHSDALDFAAGDGLVGVAVYLGLLALPIAAVLRTPRDSQFRARLYGVVLLVVSYIALGLGDEMLAFEMHTALYVVLTALLVAYCRDERLPSGPPA